MTIAASSAQTITLGDPVPWFRSQYLTGTPFDFNIAAGRWIVLAFLGNLAEPQAQAKLSALLQHAPLFAEDHIVAYVVLSAHPGAEVVTQLSTASGPGLKFVADYDGELAKLYGAKGAQRTIVLDPMLRAIGNIAWDCAEGHDQTLAGLLQSLPPVDESAGVPLTAPALIVPRVFDFPLCELLVKMYDQVGGEDSGFMEDQGGKTVTKIDYSKKRRADMTVALPELRDRIRERIVTRLLPAIKLYFQYEATRMDRYIVSCYDSKDGGHFRRHRDNLNAGAEHRRFAVSMNLNKDYDGCDLIFPEFGRRTYRAPVGGAVVFSCGALHEVTPVTRGKRYAFLPFLYGEADAAKRLENNARLKEGEIPYQLDSDLLYPDKK
jgi:hypothetical protein